MSDVRSYGDALDEIRDAVDRLTLVVIAIASCKRNPKRLDELIFPLMDEIGANRQGESFKWNPQSPYKPKD